MAEKGVDFVGSMDDGSAQSAGRMSRRGIDPACGPAAFVHNPATSTYICPEGRTPSLAQRGLFPGCLSPSGRLHARRPLGDFLAVEGKDLRKKG